MAEYTSAERSRNAKAQARDRNGRWVKQGGTVSWRQRVTGEMKTGLVVGVTGNYALVIPRLSNPTQMPQPFMLPIKSIGSTTGVKATLDRRDKKTIEAEKKYLAQLQAKFNSQQNGTDDGEDERETKRKKIDADWDARRKKWDAQRKQRDAERRARWAEQDARQAKQDKRRAQQKAEREKERAQRKADQKEQDARRAKQRAERAQDRKLREADRKQREADRLQRKADQAESDKRRAKQRAERAADRAQRLADREADRRQRAQDRAQRLKEQAQDRARTLRQRAEDDAYRAKKANEKASRQGGLRDDEVDKSPTTKSMSGYQSSLSKRITSGQPSSFKWRGLTTQVTPTKTGSRVTVHDSHGNLIDSYDFRGKDADGQANGVANKIRDLIVNKAVEEYVIDLNRDGVPDADQKNVRIPADQEFTTTKVSNTRAHQYKPGTTLKSGNKLYTKTGKMTSDNQRDGLWSSYTKQKDGSYSLDRNKDGTSRYVRSSALGGDTYDVSEALPKSGHDDPSDDISLEKGNSFNMTDEEFEKMLEEFHKNLSKSR